MLRRVDSEPSSFPSLMRVLDKRELDSDGTDTAILGCLNFVQPPKRVQLHGWTGPHILLFKRRASYISGQNPGRDESGFMKS